MEIQIGQKAEVLTNGREISPQHWHAFNKGDIVNFVEKVEDNYFLFDGSDFENGKLLSQCLRACDFKLID